MIFSLPKYVLKGFLQEWLISTDLVRLDSAVCNCRHRRGFLTDLTGTVIITVTTEVFTHRCYLWMVSRKCLIGELTVLPSKIQKKANRSFAASEYFLDIFAKLGRIQYYGHDCEAFCYILMYPLPLCREIKLQYINEDQSSLPVAVLPSSLKKLSLCGVVTCTSTDLLELLFDGKPLYLEELCIVEDPNEYTMFGSEVFDLLLPLTGQCLTSLSIMGVHDEFHSILSLLEVHCPVLSTLSIKAKTRYNDDWGLDESLRVPSVVDLALCLNDMTASNISHFPNVVTLRLLKPSRSRMQLRGLTKSMIAHLLSVLVVNSTVTRFDFQDVLVEPKAVNEITLMDKKLSGRCDFLYRVIEND